MTRQQFIENVTDWDELIDFCRDESLSVCDDIYDDDGVDEYVDRNIDDLIRQCSWWEVRDTLNGIPGDGYYYLNDGWFDFFILDNSDFEEYKQRAIDEMDCCGYWDEEITEDVFELSLEDEPDEFEIDKSVSLDDFFASNTEELRKISKESEVFAATIDAEFEKFTQHVTTVNDY